MRRIEAKGTLTSPPILPKPCSPLMGDGLFCSDPLVLLHLHQPCDQVFGWGQSQEEARHGTPSHCLEVMDVLGGRSRVQQRKLRTGPPHQSFTLPTFWAPPHPPVKCHPSMESQTHSRLPGSCGRDSCHGFRSHLPLPPHRKVGSLKVCMGPEGKIIQEGHGHRPPPGYTPPSCKPPHSPIHSQDVHDDSNGPAVYRASIPLPAYNLWGCKRSTNWLVNIRPGQAWYHSHPLPGDFLPPYPEPFLEGCLPPCPCPSTPACQGTRGSHRAP